MIYIQKNQEPEGLGKLRERLAPHHLSPSVEFNKLRNPLKNAVRESLLKEQGHLCAYCMCTIPREKEEEKKKVSSKKGEDTWEEVAVVLEHIIPRNPKDGRDVRQGLDYNNLIAVCNGNRGSHGSRAFQDLTCDVHKQETEFKKLHPCQKETLESIYYDMQGNIHATDPDVNYDLTQILNLNAKNAPLPRAREAILSQLLEEMGKISGELEGDREGICLWCQVVLEEYTKESDPKTPYSGIIMWYLKDMIRVLGGDSL